MVALVCLGSWLRLVNLGNVVTRTPDERVYTYQAKTWLDGGAAGIRSLIAEYKADADTRLYPPPTRVGMIRLVGMAMMWTGKRDEEVGARISCAASIGSLLLLALLGIRFFPPWAAATGMLLYAVLPPDLAIARRTWTDALVELFGLVLIFVVCEVTRGARAWFWYVLFAVTGSIGILFKESMPVPYGLCALWMVWILGRGREWRDVGVLAAATAVGMGLSLWWLAGQVGSLSDYVSIVLAIPSVNAANAYALEYASGPPYLMLTGFWILAPLTSLLAVAGLVAVWRSREHLVLVWLAVFVVAYIGIAMAMPHFINLRYVGNTFGSVCLLAGLGAYRLIEKGMALAGEEGRVLAVLGIAIVMGGATQDYLRFQRYFVRDQMVDLSIKMLLDERGQ